MIDETAVLDSICKKGCVFIVKKYKTVKDVWKIKK